MAVFPLERIPEATMKKVGSKSVGVQAPRREDLQKEWK
jgi:hypothetical protein